MVVNLIEYHPPPPKVPDVESKVAALIISNKISARIDSTNATLHAKHTEQRSISCRKVGRDSGSRRCCFCSFDARLPMLLGSCVLAWFLRTVVAGVLILRATRFGLVLGSICPANRYGCEDTCI